MAYKIQELLDNSVRQFDDMEPDDLEKFGASFGTTIEDSPVAVAVIDGRPVLVEGRQRLLLLRQRGKRATLHDDEVVLAPGVTTMQEAEDAALTRNLNRRQFTKTETGRFARRLMADRGLTQAQAGVILGISQSAVSKAVTAADDRDGPVTVPSQPADGEAQPDIGAGDLSPVLPPRSGLQELTSRTDIMTILLLDLRADEDSSPLIGAGCTVDDHGEPGDSDEAISAWTVRVTDAATARETALSISALAARLADLEDLIQAAVAALPETDVPV